MQTKPGIVSGHGIWTDGSCFNKAIPALLAERYEVIASSSLDINDGMSVRAGLREGVRI